MKFIIFLLALTASIVVNAEAVDHMGDKINGKPLPMNPSKSMFETRVLEATEGLDGKVIITSRTVRQAGTRSPIHMHPQGGQTCVISGEMTLYMDGAEPQVAPEGSCYWMPPGRRMSGVNTAEGQATIMLDTFIVPVGTRVWEVVEPGFEDAQNQFDKLFNTSKK